MQLDLTRSSVKDIASFYSPYPDTYLRANMVMSSDGHFVDEFGSPKQFSSDLDLKVLLTLRAISDCVLVGGKTVRSDNYRPPVLAGEFKDLSSRDRKSVV
jgi:riboflavin biosynthesis pyrimidine reductase